MGTLVESADFDLPCEMVSSTSEVETLRWELARPELITRVHSWTRGIGKGPDGKGRLPEPRCTLGPARRDDNQDSSFRLASPFPPHLVHSQHFVVTDRPQVETRVDGETEIDAEADGEV